MECQKVDIKQATRLVRSGVKKKKNTAAISAEDNNTFRELKGKVIALRKRELKILAGNLEKNPEVVENPANILDISKAYLTCPTCGKELKSELALKQHKTRRHKDENKDETKKRKVKKKDGQTNELTSLTADHNVSNNPKTEVIRLNSSEPLIAYLDTLVNLGKLDDAYREFRAFIIHPNTSRLRRYSNPEDTVEAYDIIMRGFARRFEFSRVQEVWQDMTKQKVEPSVNSYISSMIALSNCNPSFNIFKTIFSQVNAEFTNSGHSLESALRLGRFQGQDRKMFIRCFDYFSDEPRGLGAADVPYFNPLLNNIPKEPRLMSQVENVLGRAELEPLVEQQISIERQLSVRVSSIFKDDQCTNYKTFTTFMDDLELEWRDRLTYAVNRRLKLNKRAIGGKGKYLNMNSKMLLSVVPVSTLVDIIINITNEICKSGETYSLSANSLCLNLGREVMNAYHLKSKVENNKNFMAEYLEVYSRYLDWYVDPSSGDVNHRAAWLRACKDFSIDYDRKWLDGTCILVGKELRSILLEEITIVKDNNGDVVVKNKIIDRHGELQAPVHPLTSLPAFFKIYRVRNFGTEADETKPHPSLTKLYSADNMVGLNFNAIELPMVCPPLPWTSTEFGSYFFNSIELIRKPDSRISNQLEKIKHLPPGHLAPVIDAVNQLSAVPWRINENVLDLAIQVFTSKDTQDLYKPLNLPLHPDQLPPIEVDQETEELLERGAVTEKEISSMKKHYINKKLHNQLKRETYSIWCDHVYMLSIANHFKEKVLWFPHNMDFRGRVYPIPPYLNHMGSDLARSLMVFARGKPLGANGFNWLKLQCINLTGLKKKESVAARIEYADEIMHLILDSANNPLGGKRWFMESSEPWQTYTACVEIRNALNYPGGPQNYVSHLPIHQDGSCNGLQHYAAIGRDRLGAAAVNLVSADKPQDVYSEIATAVERKRMEDAEKGVKIAEVLKGFVERKVVKQTVMTTVYGVTKYGANLQIAKQLKNKKDFAGQHVKEGSKYLVDKTFESINELFTASQEIQDWLTVCAKVISSDCNMNVEWETPLGLPVVQPYTEKIGTSSKVRVMTVKHRNGFPPNFIHSLDSSHMMLTSIYLWHEGITFASVHDCFWTHACDVPTMNETCRNQFVALHSFPILEQLSQSFIDKFIEVPVDLATQERERKFKRDFPETISPLELEKKKRDILFRQVPKKGDLDLSLVKDSIYFFS